MNEISETIIFLQKCSYQILLQKFHPNFNNPLFSNSHNKGKGQSEEKEKEKEKGGRQTIKKVQIDILKSEFCLSMVYLLDPHLRYVKKTHFEMIYYLINMMNNNNNNGENSSIFKKIMIIFLKKFYEKYEDVLKKEVIDENMVNEGKEKIEIWWKKMMSEEESVVSVLKKVYENYKKMRKPNLLYDCIPKKWIVKERSSVDSEKYMEVRIEKSVFDNMNGVNYKVLKYLFSYDYIEGLIVSMIVKFENENKVKKEEGKGKGKAVEECFKYLIKYVNEKDSCCLNNINLIDNLFLYIESKNWGVSNDEDGKEIIENGKYIQRIEDFFERLPVKYYIEKKMFLYKFCYYLCNFVKTVDDYKVFIKITKYNGEISNSSKNNDDEHEEKLISDEFTKIISERVKEVGRVFPMYEYKERGKEYFKKKEFKYAIGEYKKANKASKDPEFRSVIFSNISQCYYNIVDYDKSIKYSMKSISLKNNTPKNYIRMYYCYIKKKEFKKALKTLKKLKSISTEKDFEAILKSVFEKLKIFNKQFLVQCHSCNKLDLDVNSCSSCRRVSYCSRECQKNDWKSHKYNCSSK